jgi:hypothetical protein
MEQLVVRGNRIKSYFAASVHNAELVPRDATCKRESKETLLLRYFVIRDLANRASCHDAHQLSKRVYPSSPASRSNRLTLVVEVTKLVNDPFFVVILRRRLTYVFDYVDDDLRV